MMVRGILFICFLGWVHLAQAQQYVDSLKIVVESNQPVEKIKEAIFLLGEYYVQKNPEKAESYADSLTEYFSVPIDSVEWIRLNYVYAQSNRWQGNYKTALGFYNDTYDYARRNLDSINVARSGRQIGSINMFLGNNTLAQSHFLEVANIYDAIGSPLQKASIQSSLASFYLNLEQNEKGLSRYKNALSQYIAINDSAGMASINANLGLLYSQMDSLSKAEVHLDKFQQYASVFPTDRELGFYHDFKGLLRQKQGRLDEAYVEHKIALDIREGLSSTYNLCESKLNTGRILIKLSRYEQAINHLLDVLSYDEHESLNQESAAHNALSEAYEKKGDVHSALIHFKKYKEIGDSILNKESVEIIAEKDARYKKQEQDAAIELLNKENEIAATRLSKSRLLMYGSLFGLCLFSLLSFFIYKLYANIKSKNSIIAKALDDKNLLLKEIHHRVKNNLQIISSLLNLQSRFIKDDSAIEAIKDGRNRVQSMALLHQNLYKEENLTGVRIQEYFTNLIEGIFDSYNLSEDNIALDLDIEDVNLDIDTVIPIGLITNELISNSLKYAFNETVINPTITVSLTQDLENIYLNISDNGIGMEEEVAGNGNYNSFGQRMVHAFVQKLEAAIDFNLTQGTHVEISIPKLGNVA